MSYILPVLSGADNKPTRQSGACMRQIGSGGHVRRLRPGLPQAVEEQTNFLDDRIARIDACEVFRFYAVHIMDVLQAKQVFQSIKLSFHPAGER